MGAPHCMAIEQYFPWPDPSDLTNIKLRLVPLGRLSIREQNQMGQAFLTWFLGVDTWSREWGLPSGARLQFANWKITIVSEFKRGNNHKWQFSIAMWVYQRVRKPIRPFFVRLLWITLQIHHGHGQYLLGYCTLHLFTIKFTSYPK